MIYNDRTYRRHHRQDDLVHFTVKVKETDLDIGVRRERFSPGLAQLAEKAVLDCRLPLEKYIASDPNFASSLSPYEPLDGAPPIAVEMHTFAKIAGVGPMAAVAGAVAEHVGKILSKHSKDVIVENGGDIYIRTSRIRRIAVFAGPSPLSNRIAIEIGPHQSPLGICTSSGTVGHSISFGKADAAVVLSPSTVLADAVATATGNLVRNLNDLQRAVDFASGIEGVTGVVVIKGDRLVAWGRVKLVPIRLTGS